MGRFLCIQPGAWRRHMAVSAFAVAAAWLGMSQMAWAQQQGVTDNEILIGDVMPFTGAVAVAGLAHNIGLRFAISEVNAAGGIHGRKIRLIAEDDGYVPTRTVQAVRKLIHVDKVFSIATLSGANHGVAVLPLLEQSGIPAFSVMSFSKQLYQPKKNNVFVIGQSADELLYELMLHMVQKYPGKKWGLVSQDDDAGDLVRAGFERAVKEKNLAVASRQIYTRGQQDFSSEMARFVQSGAEVLIAGGILTENVAMVKELERLGAKVPTGILYYGRYPVTLQLMGPASDGIYVADYVEAENGVKGAEFLDRLRKSISEDEFKRVNRFTLTAYAGAQTLFEAIRRCGRNGVTWSCAIGELEKLKNFDTGVMGPITFTADSHFSAMKPILMRGVFATKSYKPVD